MIKEHWWNDTGKRPEIDKLCERVPHYYNEVNKQQDAKNFSLINHFNSALLQLKCQNTINYNLSLKFIVPKAVYTVKKCS